MGKCQRFLDDAVAASKQHEIKRNEQLCKKTRAAFVKLFPECDLDCVTIGPRSVTFHDYDGFSLDFRDDIGFYCRPLRGKNSAITSVAQLGYAIREFKAWKEWRRKNW